MYEEGIIVLITLTCFNILSLYQSVTDYEFVVYEGTFVIVGAAIQGSRMRKSVVLIKSSFRIRGLITRGPGNAYIGKKQIIGSISRSIDQSIPVQKISYEELRPPLERAHQRLK